jgi:hypothetical protein
MLELGIIQSSTSPWCSPVVVVAKPDQTIRLCLNFRALNWNSKFDSCPLPKIDELLETVGNKKVFNILDLTKGYWQIKLTRESMEKTAFQIESALYEFCGVPFGLHGVPATFQRLMDRILRDCRHFAKAYLDNIIIFSDDWQEPCTRSHQTNHGSRSKDPPKEV